MDDVGVAPARVIASVPEVAIRSNSDSSDRLVGATAAVRGSNRRAWSARSHEDLLRERAWDEH